MGASTENIGTAVASITIRNLDEHTMDRLRTRAAGRRRSLADEARHVILDALTEDTAPPRNLAEAIRRRFQPHGGVDLRLPGRSKRKNPTTK